MSLQEQQPVSIDEALARGHRMVNIPVMVILFLGIGATLAAGVLKLAPVWIYPVGIVLSVVLAWIWWSVWITKWRLWAFGQVRNVHELKKRAIREKLIWPDKHVFEKTEIRSAAEQQQWNQLQERFSQKDRFEDNPAVPDETVICYSKVSNYLELVILLSCAVFGIYLYIKQQDRLVGFFFFATGAFLSVKRFRKAFNRSPQIILNDKGLETAQTGFIRWREVRNEDVTTSGTGRYSHSYLQFDHPGGAEAIDITDLDTDEVTLSNLLTVYRGRHENQRQQKQME